MDSAADPVALRPVSDLAGTPVEDADGRSIGELFGALAEADSGLLRYFDLSLFNRARHVLVPVGHGRIEQRIDEPRLRLRAATLEDLERIPAYHADPDAMDDPYERALLHAYGRSFHGERYYAHPAYDHRGLYAGEHPLVRGGDDAAAGGLAPASSLPSLVFAAGAPDVRGQPLESGDGSRGAVIDDLIVDIRERQVRYVVARTGPGRRVLLPVGFLQADDRAGVVRAPGLLEGDLDALPAWKGGAVEREEEEALRSAIAALLDDRRRRYDGPDYRHHHPA
jgi:hypothetical protein